MLEVDEVLGRDKGGFPLSCLASRFGTGLFTTVIRNTSITPSASSASRSDIRVRWRGAGGEAKVYGAVAVCYSKFVSKELL